MPNLLTTPFAGTTLLAFIAAVCTMSAAPAPPVSVIPWPKNVTMQPGTMSLGARTCLLTPDAALEPLAPILSEEIYLATGRKVAVRQAAARGDDVIALHLDLKLAKEAYVLKITPQGVELRGGSYTAVAMGAATLLQALQTAGDSVSLPAMLVEDQPQSEYDGLMVDVARRPNSIEALRQCVMLCHLYKIRQFHLHLSDDQGFTFPSTAYPMLGRNNGGMDGRGAPFRYPLGDLKELVKFADARGVTIVPEMEVPGHSGALAGALPEIFGAKDPKTGKIHGMGVINVANEAIYPVLDTLVGEICDVFKSSPYFHIGGDECYWYNFEQTDDYKEVMKRAGHKATGDLFAAFLNRMNAIVKKHGRKTICWEGFNPGRAVDKDIIVMAWGGGHETLVKRGHRIINVPWVPQVYSTPRENYEWTLWHVGPEGRKPAPMSRTNSVIGAQMVLWERPGDEALRLLRATAPPRHEQVYHPDAGRTFEDFEQRFQSTDRLVDRLIVPVKISVEGLRKIEGAPEVRNEAALQIGGNVLFPDALTVRLDPALARSGETIHYTLDGREPTAASPVYTGPFKVTEKETRHWQPNVNYVPISEATIKARLFAGETPVGYTSMARYHFDYLAKLPRAVKFSLYEAPKSLKKFPADPADLKPLFTGLEPRIDLRSLPHVRLPAHKACLWEGAALFDKEGDYEFQLRSFDGTSQLFVDGNLVLDRNQTDWGQTEARLHLTAGPHQIKVNFCGKSDFMTIGWRAAGGQKFVPLKFQEIVPAQ